MRLQWNNNSTEYPIGKPIAVKTKNQEYPALVVMGDDEEHVYIEKYINIPEGTIKMNKITAWAEIEPLNMAYNDMTEYLKILINNNKLADAHTRKELADILRRMMPYLVKQSDRACFSMCKRRIEEHIKFALNLHKVKKEETIIDDKETDEQLKSNYRVKSLLWETRGYIDSNNMLINGIQDLRDKIKEDRIRGCAFCRAEYTVKDLDKIQNGICTNCGFPIYEAIPKKEEDIKELDKRLYNSLVKATNIPEYLEDGSIIGCANCDCTFTEDELKYAKKTMKCKRCGTFITRCKWRNGEGKVIQSPEKQHKIFENYKSRKR